MQIDYESNLEELMESLHNILDNSRCSRAYVSQGNIVCLQFMTAEKKDGLASNENATRGIHSWHSHWTLTYHDLTFNDESADWCAAEDAVKKLEGVSVNEWQLDNQTHQLSISFSNGYIWQTTPMDDEDIRDRDAWETRIDHTFWNVVCNGVIHKSVCSL